MSSFTNVIRSLYGGSGARGNCRRQLDLHARLSPHGLEVLEGRVVPSISFDLGAAGQFGVLGLHRTVINDQTVAVTGNVGVSRGGTLFNHRLSTITGNVDEFAKSQYRGHGTVGGSIVVDSALLTQADQDALQASSLAAALTPTQTFGSISTATTVTGNGDVNVIAINGNITASLILSGGTNDVFVVNVTGSLNLRGSSVLGLAGGVTADHVIYNFVGRHTITARAQNVLNGTLLAPHGSFNLNGTTVNGEIVAGGAGVLLTGGAWVNQVTFTPPVAQQPAATISGFVFSDDNRNGQIDPGESFFPNITVTLSGIDANGNAVNEMVQTDDNGFYSFGPLAAGTYTITFSPPSAGTAELGTGAVNDGSISPSAPDVISGVVVSATSQGTNFNFAVFPTF
jgi:hypothetical protein